jgi:predicted ribosomally synthesized peptide with nif11-like leader
VSDQGAKAFVDKMGSDQAFQAAILAEASIEGRARMAQAAGFDCTADEIMGLTGLSDDQLDGVAGGTGSAGFLLNQSVDSMGSGSASGLYGSSSGPHVVL